MSNNQATSQKFWPRHVSWPTIALALLAIITFIVISQPGQQYYPTMYGNSGTKGAVPPMMEGGGISAPAPSGVDSNVYYPYPYPYQNPDVPVTDTREFLKVYYNASIRTRDVQGLAQRVETTVRGYSGRIDQESISQQYAYVSFAIPQSKYLAFRAEIESLVPSRFLTLNISSQNLLPQKQSIEQQQTQADTTLAAYKTARQKLVAAHASTVQSLQSRIDADTSELTILRAQTQTPQIVAQIQTVSDDLTSLKKQLANENASYTVQLSDADRNIKYGQDWVKGVQTQDKTLLDNVATVTGTISISWISLWGSALLYLPGYWIPFILALLSFLSLLYDRRRFGTR